MQPGDNKMQDSNRKPIEIQLVENAAIVRFVRPEIKNPLSIETLRMLEWEFSIIEKRPDIETIIFTGSGNTFAAGANLNEIASLTGDKAKEFGLYGQNLMQKISGSSKRTIAAIDGFCMGGALDLALACDTRIASPRSVFAHPGVGLGIITGWGGTQMLPRLIGESRSMEMFLTGRRIPAEEAYKFGLINKIENKPLEASVLWLSETSK